MTARGGGAGRLRVRLPDIEVILPALGHRLQHHVHMGMGLVGVERERMIGLSEGRLW